MMSEHAARRTFLIVAALLFAASLTASVVGCRAMAAAGALLRPCGWTVTMGWTPMPGQSAASAVASFLGMWTVMMVAMMLPSLMPVLWRCQMSISRAGVRHVGRQIVLIGFSYFLAWSAVGFSALPLALTLGAVAAQLPAPGRDIPVVLGMVALVAGMLQFTAWKVRHLAHCRVADLWDRAPPVRVIDALGLGLHLGRHCMASCVGATAIVIVTGGMDLVVMALVTGAITLERLAPGGMRAAHLLGAAAMAAGGWLILGGAV
ncbi:MAG: DUF2182 domain-containing protein [Pseudomonadota bacterium]